MALLVTPRYVAEIVAVLVLVTFFAVTVKVVLVEPAGTVTLLGTVATPVALLDSDTTAPGEGGGPLNVTVPWEVLPPGTLVGFRMSETKPGTVTFRVAVRVVPPALAEMVTDVAAETAFVVMVKATVVLPLGTVTFAGTVATDVLSLESVTITPPVGAGPLKVTVP